MPTRWYNPNLPQTLVISQFLLYFGAFYGILEVLRGQSIGYLILVVASIYGAGGIASALKVGYRVAVVASFLPLILRALEAIETGEVLANLRDILLGNVIDALFQYALIALLLHPQSRDHQRIWFE